MGKGGVAPRVTGSTASISISLFLHALLSPLPPKQAGVLVAWAGYRGSVMGQEAVVYQCRAGFGSG